MERTLIEPEEILADIADVRPVVAISAPASVLPVGPFAGVVAKLSTRPRRKTTVDCIARRWRKQLDVCERARREREHTQEHVLQLHGYGGGRLCPGSGRSL